MFRAERSRMRGPKQRDPSKGIPAVRTEWKDSVLKDPSTGGIRAK